jgi:hypothetical protein
MLCSQFVVGGFLRGSVADDNCRGSRRNLLRVESISHGRSLFKVHTDGRKQNGALGHSWRSPIQVQTKVVTADLNCQYVTIKSVLCILLTMSDPGFLHKGAADFGRAKPTCCM